jgi:hypothetical protein
MLHQQQHTVLPACLPACCRTCAACFLTFYEEVLPPQFRALIPSVSKGCLQPFMIFQVAGRAAAHSQHRLPPEGVCRM